ncbi:MAG: ABC transporter ATP-binding protein [Alphaproteobacteria bacterium]|nr:ABC transporter ATP-binding protein [Alphaproteobacteria bacterium]
MNKAVVENPRGSALVLNDIEKSFAQGAQGKHRLHVLNGASLAIQPGEMVALVGPSGSGKSTLLNIAGLLENPDSGSVMVDGKATARMKDKERAALRRKKIGFVFQFHRLLPEFSAFENILIPQMLAKLPRAEASSRAEQLLALVGLSDRRDHRPGQLSGGEQQRVAIARAVSNAPSVLLADEPTGNLDPETARDVFKHLTAIIRQTQTAALIVTHNTELAASMDRVLTIRDGVLSEHP